MIAIQTIIFQKYPIERMLSTLQEKGINKIELWEGHIPFKTPGNFRILGSVLSFSQKQGDCAWHGHEPSPSEIL